MCVRFFVRLIIVYALIVSRNQACCHGGSSKNLASVNQKTAQATKPASMKKLEEMDPKKYIDDPKDWTNTKYTVGNGLEKSHSRLRTDSDDLSEEIGNGFKGYKFMDSDISATSKDGFMSSQKAGKSTFKAEKDSFEQDLAEEIYRITKGWDEDEKLMLKDIDKNRLQTITAKDQDSSDNSLESDYYKRIAPDRHISVGEPSSKPESEYRRLDANHVRDFNLKKIKALESFADMDSESEDFQINTVGESNKKFEGGKIFKNQNTEEGFTSSEESDYILANLIESDIHGGKPSTAKEDIINNYKIPSEDANKNPVSQSFNQKSTADILSEYGDVLEKVEEIYKLLNPPKKSGAKYSNSPRLIDSNMENEIDIEDLPYQAKMKDWQFANPRNIPNSHVDNYQKNSRRFETSGAQSPETRRMYDDSYAKQGLKVTSEPVYSEHSRRGPEFNLELGHSENSRWKPEINSEMRHREYSRKEPDIDPEYSRWRPDAEAKLNNREYAKGQSDVYPTYSGRKSEIDSIRSYPEYSRREPDIYPEYARRKSKADQGLLYPNYSSEEYTDLEPNRRNLASPQCKFENLDPSRELVSGEDERFLQFRSSGNRKAGNIVGQNRKNELPGDLASVAQNHNNNRKSHMQLDGDHDSILSASRCGQKYQNYDNEARIALSPYRGHGDANLDDISGKPAPKLGAAAAKNSQNVEKSKYSNNKRRFEELEMSSQGRKVDNMSAFPRKAAVAAKTPGKNDVSTLDFERAPSYQRQGNSNHLTGARKTNTMDYSDVKDMTTTENRRVGDRKKENALGSPRSALDIHKDKLAMNRAQRLNLKDSGTGPYSSEEEEEVLQRPTMAEVISEAKINQPTSFHLQVPEVQHLQVPEVQHLQVSPQTQDNPQHVTGAHNSIGEQAQIIGLSHQRDGLEQVGHAHGSATEVAVTPQFSAGETTVSTHGPQFPDLKTLQNEKEEMSNTNGEAETLPGQPSGDGGCTSIFKCLAEMGQTLINPPSNLETKVTHSPPHHAHLGHSAHTEPHSSNDVSTTGPQSFTCDTSSRTEGFLGGLTERIASARHDFGSNFMRDHPFYGMVTSIIEAAQEATKQRLLEGRHANLRHHPEKVQLPQPNLQAVAAQPIMQAVAPQPNLQVTAGSEHKSPGMPPAQGLTITPQTGTGQCVAPVVSAPESLNNLSEAGKSEVAKASPLIGNEKKPATTGNGKVLKTIKTDFLNKSKAPQSTNVGTTQTNNLNRKNQIDIVGKARAHNVGNIKQKAEDSQKMVMPKDDDSKRKVGVFKKVDFQPVSLIKSNTKEPNSLRDKQPLTLVRQRADPKSKTVTVTSSSRKTEPKTKTAAVNMSVALTPGKVETSALSAPASSQIKLSPLKQRASTSTPLKTAK